MTASCKRLNQVTSSDRSRFPMLSLTRNRLWLIEASETNDVASSQLVVGSTFWNSLFKLADTLSDFHFARLWSLLAKARGLRRPRRTPPSYRTRKSSGRQVPMKPSVVLARGLTHQQYGEVTQIDPETCRVYQLVWRMPFASIYNTNIGVSDVTHYWSCQFCQSNQYFSMPPPNSCNSHAGRAPRFQATLTVRSPF